MRPLKPTTRLVPANGTRLTSRLSPGSNRIAVPAGMSKRLPRALSRSNWSAALASKKWKCEPTCTGRSPLLETLRMVTGRSGLSSISPGSGISSPGIRGSIGNFSESGRAE